MIRLFARKILPFSPMPMIEMLADADFNSKLPQEMKDTAGRYTVGEMVEIYRQYQIDLKAGVLQ